jgi:hypothetical protein
MKKFIIIFLVLTFSNLALSQNKVKGLGLSKCTTFTSVSLEEKVIYMSWVAGFITSHNVLKDKFHSKNISYNMSQSWLESFCYKNPNITFKEAVQKFIFEFTK